MPNSCTSTQSSTSRLKHSSKSPQSKRYLGEKIMSLMFDGLSGTHSSKNDRELREKYDEDQLDIPRTEQEEKERQLRLRTRAEIVGGGDGVRTNDMQKEGWGGANLAPSHA
jgi:hypothetical protein